MLRSVSHGRRESNERDTNVEHEVVESNPVCCSVCEDEAGERIQDAKRHAYRTAIRSTMKTRVSFGPMAPPAPRAP